MELKLFVEDLKGYMDTYLNVRRVKIKKIDGKKVLVVEYWLSIKEDEIIPLKEINLAFLVDLKNHEEYFRYDK